MGLLIQVTNDEWRRISERALEIGGESLSEQERAVVKAYFDLCEPFVEFAQVQLMHEPVEFGVLQFNLPDEKQAA